jgi:hypothetical protein
VSSIRGLVRAGKIFRNIGDYQNPKFEGKQDRINLEFKINNIY